MEWGAQSWGHCPHPHPVEGSQCPVPTQGSWGQQLGATQHGRTAVSGAEVAPEPPHAVTPPRHGHPRAAGDSPKWGQMWGRRPSTQGGGGGGERAAERGGGRTPPASPSAAPAQLPPDPPCHPLPCRPSMPPQGVPTPGCHPLPSQPWIPRSQGRAGTHSGVLGEREEEEDVVTMGTKTPLSGAGSACPPTHGTALHPFIHCPPRPSHPWVGAAPLVGTARPRNVHLSIHPRPIHRLFQFPTPGTSRCPPTPVHLTVHPLSHPPGSLSIHPHTGTLPHPPRTFCPDPCPLICPSMGTARH